MESGRRLVKTVVLVFIASALPAGLPAAACAAEGRIVYEDQQRQHTVYEIATVAPDGSDQNQLTDTKDRTEGWPVWSPDGTEIAFVRRDIPLHLFAMNADGSDVRRLTRSPEVEAGFDGQGYGLVYGFDWSPTSDQLVYGYGFDGSRGCFPSGRSRSSILVVDADGTGHRRLTGTRAQHFDPAWSSDGRTILYGKDPVSGRPGLFTMNSDGTQKKRLTGPRRASDFDASWSPDGSQILFARVSRRGDVGIYTMNSDGTAKQALTSLDGRRLDPSWSPDGTQVAFLRGQGTTLSLYIMNTDGTDKRLVANDVVNADHGDYYYDWSPTSQRLVYEYFFEEENHIDLYVINVDGSGRRLLAGGEGDQAMPRWQSLSEP